MGSQNSLGFFPLAMRKSLSLACFIDSHKKNTDVNNRITIGMLSGFVTIFRKFSSGKQNTNPPIRRTRRIPPPTFVQTRSNLKYLFHFSNHFVGGTKKKYSNNREADFGISKYIYPMLDHDNRLLLRVIADQMLPHLFEHAKNGRP